MSGSFSSETKNDLCGVFLKSLCCKRAFLYGALMGGGELRADEASLTTEHEKFAVLYCKILRSVFRISLTPSVHKPMRVTGADAARMLEAFGYAVGEDPCTRIVEDGMTCPEDRGAFLRGVFLACGTVTMPDSSYHLELMPQPAAFREALRGFLGAQDLMPKVLKRSSRREESLYYKDSGAMEDFLNFIGAQRSAFQLMNVKIKRDLRNNANRVANCDMANIDKTITAATRQMEAIWQIAEDGRADELSPALRQTFDLRAAFPDISLIELAARHEPPISKSGVSHRLSKLIAFAAEGRKHSDTQPEEE